MDNYDKIGINSVAELAGVSITTVSRVINGSTLVSEKTKTAVFDAIEKLNYHPNVLARSLRKNKTNTIGVVVSNNTNPFFMSVVSGIEKTANLMGYSIILCNSYEDSEKEEEHILRLLSYQIDGYIVAATGSEPNWMRWLNNKPVVFIDRKPDNKTDFVYDTVMVDNVKGSRMAVNCLFSRGCRRIAFLNGSLRSSTGRERLEGFREAYSDNGLEFENEFVMETSFLGNSVQEYAEKVLSDPKFDAVFTGNNLILQELLKVAKAKGMSFPRDKGLATFDDVDWLEYCESRIISVRQPTFDIGVTAMKLLGSRMDGYEGKGRDVVLDASLIVR